MPTRRALLAAVAFAPVLAGCGLGPDLSAPPLRLDKVWDGKANGSSGNPITLLTARLRVLADDLLIHANGTGTKDTWIAAMDIATGNPRWRIDGDRLLNAPGVGRVRISLSGPGENGFWDQVIQKPIIKSAGDIMPIAYVTGDGARAASGVIGVRLGTGQPVWAVPATPKPTTDRTVITAVSDSVVLMTVAPPVPIGPNWPSLDASVVTIAVDPRTGARLWSVRDLIGLGADGTWVMVARRTRSSRHQARWMPQILDARTGEPRWEGDQVMVGPYDHRATAADHTVLTHGDRKGAMIIQLSTGTVFEQKGDSVPIPVASDPPLLVWDTGPDWWSRGPNGFVTQPLPDGRPAVGRKRPEGSRFDAAVGVGDPYIWGTYGATNGGGQHLSGVVAVDRTGAPRTPVLSGLLASVTDRWLVITVPNGFQVYRITKP